MAGSGEILREKQYSYQRQSLMRLLFPLSGAFQEKTWRSCYRLFIYKSLEAGTGLQDCNKTENRAYTIAAVKT